MMKIIFLIICAVLVVAAVLGVGFVYDVFLIQPETDAQKITFTVEEGWGAEKIASELKAAGVVRSAQYFSLYVVLTHNIANLQAGVFEFAPGSSIKTVVSSMTNARAQEVRITIPEGYSTEQISDIVVQALPRITKEGWEQAVEQIGIGLLGVEDILAGIPNGQKLEGYLFPDTYRFRADADAKTIIETMVMTLARRLAEKGIVPPSAAEKYEFDNGMTLHEVLTLASIVEREVKSQEDMRLVAGVFLSRVKIGMALQADSTVNFLTGKKDIAVSLEDSKIDSPYNTYRRVGLPPGPICNPGMNAILAVMQPQDSEYLYFLTAKDGKVVYAKTYSEHVSNKKKFLY
jgi:UPF0755 protein